MIKSINLICITTILLLSCTNKFDKNWTTEKAPNNYVTRLYTTKGNIDIEVNREASPNAADRFYQLVKNNFFSNATFYRVVPGFVAQFSNTDTLTANPWKEIPILDEPVKRGNNKGNLSFARLGKNSRSVDVFINLNNNTKLDTIVFEGVVGFASFGQVIAGMDVAENLFSGYAEETMADSDVFDNVTLLRKKYPNLDRIYRAEIITQKP